jgi:hypothetical protein
MPREIKKSIWKYSHCWTAKGRIRIISCAGANKTKENQSNSLNNDQFYYT